MPSQFIVDVTCGCHRVTFLAHTNYALLFYNGSTCDWAPIGDNGNQQSDSTSHRFCLVYQLMIVFLLVMLLYVCHGYHSTRTVLMPNLPNMISWVGSNWLLAKLERSTLISLGLTSQLRFVTQSIKFSYWWMLCLQWLCCRWPVSECIISIITKAVWHSFLENFHTSVVCLVKFCLFRVRWIQSGIIDIICQCFILK